MPNQHATKGISWHPKDPTLKQWIEAEAAARGTTRSVILDEALGEYRKKAELLRPLRDAAEARAVNREIATKLRGEQQ